jgi:Ca-activated chloride channel family protein
MIADLHFLRPWWWLAALPLPLMLWAMLRNQGGRAALSRLADASLLPYLIRDGGKRALWALALAAAIWLLAVAALAGPAWQRAPMPLYANGAARVVALSLSNDMRAQDLKPDRMTRARYAVRDLLDQAGDARTALIGYAGDAFVVAPLTPDKATVLNLLQALGPDVMPAPGNDAARAIAQALDLLKQAHVEGGEIVLVTDNADASAIAAARAARAAGVRVDVLGLGSAQGAPVPQVDGGFERDRSGAVRIARRDDDALREVADAGGGRYAPLGSDGGGVMTIGAPAATQSASANKEQANLWRDGGAWLLIPLLPLAALAFRRGWVCVLALAFVVPQTRAAALDSLWLRPDQRALHALQDGDYARAQELAHDPQLRGAAAYRKGDYATAAKEFAQGQSALSQYDLGNALAKSGKYDEAIAAYDRVLQRDPRSADARANKKAVQEWLKQHPQQSPQQNAQGAQGSGAQSQNGAGKNQTSKASPSQQDQRGESGQSLAQNQRARAGANSGSARDSGHADSAAGKANGGDQRSGDTGASLAEDAQQRAEAQRARQGLQQELARRGMKAEEAQRKAQGAYALGEGSSDDDGKFDPQQRAMLDAVPDDPGALLRRKFLLEWQRRHGQSSDDDDQ